MVPLVLVLLYFCSALTPDPVGLLRSSSSPSASSLCIVERDERDSDPGTSIHLHVQPSSADPKHYPLAPSTQNWEYLG
ncbi:hypothetical protein N658DRAFT_206838 [Parathielavia hyrcaniae]|uniref:Secreted protein n=1 Tax=Parathielavia hyrcaniae TaxID=113614 RepID=A0AAN6SZV0_9PEZI|nr:hypothetical protein N658DRAFT_206838 [Parathielavia hyrcaniae]